MLVHIIKIKKKNYSSEFNFRWRNKQLEFCEVQVLQIWNTNFILKEKKKKKQQKLALNLILLFRIIMFCNYKV